MHTGFGFMKTPDLLTFSIYRHWSSIDIKRWIIPRPPCLAISIAMADYVTVSMGEEMKGTFRGMFLEK
jgi:hypothetical protein